MGLSIQTMTEYEQEKLEKHFNGIFLRENLSSVLLFLSAPAETSFGSAWPQTESQT